MEFRVATSADRQAVEAVLHRSYATLLRDAYDPDLLDAALEVIAVAQEALLTSGTYLLAEDGARLLGAGGWTAGAPGSGAVTPGWAHIRHVAIDPEAAGQGVGRALMECLIGGAEAAGHGSLEVLSTMNAVGFYRRVGFVPQETVVVELSGGIPFPSVRMERVGHG